MHLRDQRHRELLLAIGGYARGATFVLFADLGGTSTQISEEIEQAHHPVHVLETSVEGWHDFETYVPLWGSGGKEVLVSTYSWMGKGYRLRQSVAGMWCDLAPFKSDATRCPPIPPPAVAPQIDLGEVMSQVEKVGDTDLRLYRGGVRFTTGRAVWTVRTSDLPLTPKDVEDSSGERVPGLAGVDARRGLVYLSLNLDSGSNVPLALYELRVRTREILRVGTTFGSGVDGCAVSDDEERVVCSVGSHASAAVGSRHSETLPRPGPAPAIPKAP